MKLDLTRDAHRFLDGLPAKQYRQVAGTVLGLLKNPEPHDSEPLRGHPFRRVDVGEYRIIYRIEEDTVKVALIGKRNDDEVYKQLRNKTR